MKHNYGDAAIPNVSTKTTNLDFTINQQVVYQLSICKLRGAQITPLRIISSRERTEILFRHREKITSRMQTHIIMNIMMLVIHRIIMIKNDEC